MTLSRPEQLQHTCSLMNATLGMPPSSLPKCDAQASSAGCREIDDFMTVPRSRPG
jgi:hypothetical protein